MKTIAQLINSGTSLINIKDYKCISVFNKEELSNLKEVSIWIVNLHLNWDNNHLQNNYGLDIGVYIRKELKSKAPILFYSHLKEENFTKIIRATDFKYKLLETPECHYIEAPIDQAKLEALIASTSPISNFCLEDIIYYVFDAKGRIDELCHNLKNDLTKATDEESINNNKNSIIEKFRIDCTNEILTQNSTKLNEIIEELKKELNEKLSRDNTYFDVINRYKPQISALCPASDDDVPIMQESENINWQAIYLEDDKQVATKVKGYFNENGVTCHIASSESEAKEIIDQNPNVNLFITDIRLKYEDGKWHKHQGYDVIEQIANHAKIPLVFAVLTSKKGSIINSAKQKLQHQIFWENKDNVLYSKQAFDVYFNRLVRIINDNDITSFTPKSDKWTSGNRVEKFKYPHSEYYKHYRLLSQSDYKIFENKITINLVNNTIPIETTGTLIKQIIDKDELCKFVDKLIFRRFILKTIFESKNAEDANEIIDSKLNLTYNTRKKFYSEHVCMSTKFENTIREVISFHNTNKGNSGILKEEYEFLKNNGLIKNFLNDELNKNNYSGKR